MIYLFLFILSTVVIAQFSDEVYELFEDDTLEIPITIIGTSALTLSVSVLTEDGTATG